MNKQELQDKKMALVQEAEAILTHAREENRYDLRGDEQAKFDALHAEVEKISTFLQNEAKLEAYAKTEGRTADPNPTPTRAKTTVHQATEREHAEALRAWMIGGRQDADLSDAQRAAAQRVGINLASNRLVLNLMGPKQLRAADLKNPSADDIRSWKEETRAALTGAQSTTTTGGYTVADDMMQALEIALLKFGAMRQVSQVIRTATGGPLPIPTTNDTSNKGRLLSENTAATETEMTFGQLVLDAYKYSSDYVLASVEFLQDSSIDVNGFLGTALGTRIGRLQNDHFTTGDGSSKPRGIVAAAASSSVTFSGTATITYDNVVDLIHSVDPEYRVGAKFMFHDGALKMLKKVKVLQYSGDTAGVPLWQPSLVAGQPDLIHGYPYVVNQSMATPAGSAKSILFGDFSKYIIRDVRQVELLRLNERYAEQHSVAFLAFARADGDLLDAGTNPVKYGVQA